MKERTQGNLALHASKRRSDAEVDAEAERHVAIVGAGEVEPVGIGEMAGVPVGRADGGNDHASAWDLAAADLNVSIGDPCRPLDRAVVSQKLLDGGRDERRIVLELCHLVGMLEQGQRAIADQVHRGLVTSDEEEQAHGEQLTLVQLVALLFNGDQETEKVRLWMFPAFRKQTKEIVSKMPAGLRATRHDIRIRQETDGIEASGDVG